MIKFLFIAGLLMMVVAPAQADPLKNDPLIKESMQVYQNIEKKLSTNKFKKQECADQTLYTDDAGKVRNYQATAGSEDSLIRYDYYYDDAGVLRLLLIRCGNVGGCKLEEFVYFDRKGKQIGKDRKQRAGPCYAFLSNWSSSMEEPVYNPKDAYKNQCDNSASEGE